MVTQLGTNGALHGFFTTVPCCSERFAASPRNHVAETVNVPEHLVEVFGRAFEFSPITIPVKDAHRVFDEVTCPLHGAKFDVRTGEVLRVSMLAQNGLSFDLSTSTGKPMRTTMGGLAEFEGDLIRDRVKSGPAAARARGVKFGRQHSGLQTRRPTD